MSQLVQGSVTITLPEGQEIPAEAGGLDKATVSRTERLRENGPYVAAQTALVIRENPDRYMIPGITPEDLEKKAAQATGLDKVIVDLETLLVKLKQADLLHGAELHKTLRKVMAYLRAQEKFDPRVSDEMQAMYAYFARE